MLIIRKRKCRALHRHLLIDLIERLKSVAWEAGTSSPQVHPPPKKKLNGSEQLAQSWMRGEYGHEPHQASSFSGTSFEEMGITKTVTRTEAGACWLWESAPEPNRNLWLFLHCIYKYVFFKICNNSFRCLTQILSQAFPPHFQSNWLFPWRRAITLIARLSVFSLPGLRVQLFKVVSFCGPHFTSPGMSAPNRDCPGLGNASINTFGLDFTERISCS